MGHHLELQLDFQACLSHDFGGANISESAKHVFEGQDLGMYLFVL